MGRIKIIKPAESATGLRENASDSETEKILRDPIVMKCLDLPGGNMKLAKLYL
jgi:hypothetical protein